MTFWAFLAMLALLGAGFALKGYGGAILALFLFLPALLGRWGRY